MAAGETTVGGIVGFLRMDDAEFNRTIDAAIARIRALGAMDADVDVRIDTHGADEDLDRLTRRAGEADRSVNRMGRSFNGLSLRNPTVILAAVAGGIALIGPVAGAATAGVAGLTGVLGTAALAWKGYQAEIKNGTALGGALQSELDGLSGTLHRLEATAAQAMGPGLIFGLTRLNDFLPDVDFSVSKLGKSLGRAFDISAEGVVSGLQAMMPLLEDGGVYAEQLAQKFADFTQSQDFRDFIDYARRELPQVGAAIGSLIKGLVELGTTLAPVGDAMVGMIDQTGKALGYLSKAMNPVIDSAKWLATHGIGQGAWEDHKKAVEDDATAVQKHAEASQTSLQAVDAQVSAQSRLASIMGTSTGTLLAAEAAQRKNADATAAATALMQQENDAAGLLKQSLDLLNGKAISAASAQNAFDSSLANMGDHVTAQGKKIHFTTTSIKDMSAASVALRGQLIQQVQNAQAVIEANGGMTDSTGKVTQQAKALRKQIIDNAVAHGVDRKAAQAYIDTLFKVPKKVPPTRLDVDKTQADAALTALARHLSVVTQPRSVTVTTRLVTIGSGPFSGKKVPTGSSAEGGTVGGHGAPQADDQPYWLSTGEEVINAKSAKKWRPFLKAINAEGLAAGGTVGMASGGTAGGWPGLDATLISHLGKDLGAKVVQAFADGMSGGKGAVKSVAEQIRSIVSDNAKKAADDLKSLLDDQASYAKQVGGSFLSAGSLTDTQERGQLFNVGPDGVMREDTTPAFVGQLQSALGQTTDFKATINRLVKLGARTDVLQEFLDKGPEAADAAAALAAMGKSGVADVNRLQGQLVAATTSLGSLGASAVYGPRVSAARSSVADAKALEVAVNRGTASQTAETRKVTAELRRINLQLQRQAQDLVDALEHVGARKQGAGRNLPAR